MFRVSSERVRYLTPDEEKRVFEQLDNCEWLKPFVPIALHTGMQRGEICNLQWNKQPFSAEKPGGFSGCIWELASEIFRQFPRRVWWA